MSTLYDEFDLDVEYRLANWESLLDQDDLINREDGLSSDLVLWALGLPNREGPTTWPFLIGGDGTLTNGPTWSGARGIDGAANALTCDGVDDYVAAGNSLNIYPFSVAVRCRVGAVGSQLLAWTQGQAATTFGAFAVLGVDASGFPVCLVRQVDGGNVATVTAGSAVSAGTILTLGVTWSSGASRTLYVNGASAGTDTTDLSAEVPIAWTNRYLGVLSRASFSGFWIGQISSAAQWSRGLSAAEHARWHEESRRGYPHLLNWRRPAVRYFAFTGGGDVLISGTVSAVSTAGNASLSADKLLQGSVDSVSTCAASLSRDAGLVGSAAGISVVNANLVVSWALAGTVTSVSTVNGTLTTNETLIAGSCTAVSTATAALVRDYSLQGSATGASTAAGTMVADKAMLAVVSSISTLNANLSRDAGLLGDVAALSGADANMVVDWSLRAAVQVQSNMTAELFVEQAYYPTVVQSVNFDVFLPLFAAEVHYDLR